MIEERIKLSLEPPNAQISLLTQLLSQLIQNNAARISTTVGPLTHNTQSEPSHGSGFGNSRALPGKQLEMRDVHPTAQFASLISPNNYLVYKLDSIFSESILFLEPALT